VIAVKKGCARALEKGVRKRRAAKDPVKEVQTERKQAIAVELKKNDEIEVRKMASETETVSPNLPSAASTRKIVHTCVIDTCQTAARRRRTTGTGAEGRRMAIKVKIVTGTDLATRLVAETKKGTGLMRGNQPGEQTAPAAIAAEIETRWVKRAGNFCCC
jgi:hypothetical protein